MIICIGPVCIPLWGLLPVLTVWLVQAWAWLKQRLGWGKATEVPPPEDTSPAAEDKSAAPSVEENLNSGLRRRLRRYPSTVTEILDRRTWDTTLRPTTTDPNQQGKRILVVSFGATWCAPCQKLKPAFGELCEQYDGLFAKVDVDDLEDVAMELGIAALPTFLVFQGSVEVERLVGPSSDKALRDWVAKHFAG